MGQKVYGFRVLLFISSIAKKRTRPSTAKKKKKKAFFFSTAKKRRRPSTLQATKTPTSKLRSLLRCSNKQAPEPEKLRRSSGACCVAAVSKPGSFRSLLRCNKQAPEPEKLRSLLRCSSKQALELAALQQASSGAYCVAAASKLRSLLCCRSKQARELPELAALQQARSGASGACCIIAASKLQSSEEVPELAVL